MSLVYNSNTGLYSISGSPGAGYPASPFITANGSNVLTNKTIDYGSNTILNLPLSTYITAVSTTTLTNKTIDYNTNTIQNLPASTPTGIINPYAGSSAPSGWLLCYGQAISRTTYSALFTIISTTYGTGDGSTTFNLPDLRGRFLGGLDNMGGSAAFRLKNDVSGGIDGTTLGATGGEYAHALTTGELASHTHNFSYGYAPGNTTTAGGNYANFDMCQNNGGSTSSGSYVQSTGNGYTHNTVPPAIIVAYIIKT